MANPRTRYNLHPIGAVCTECGKKTVKRQLVSWPKLHVDRCECGGHLPYQKLSWDRYVEYMLEEATLVDTGGDT